jgi:hypothetical protein
MVALTANKPLFVHESVTACTLQVERNYYNEQLEDKASYPAVLMGNLICLLDDNCADFYPVLGNSQMQMRKAGPKAIMQRIPVHADFKIYPNPATNYTSLVYQTNSSSRKFMLGIFNSQGQIVQSMELTKNRDEIVIATDQFAPGLYLIQLRDENGQIIGSGKLVKK